MAKRKSKAEEESAGADVAAPEAEASEAAEETSGKDQVAIKHRDHTGTVVTRVFSKEVHGADFKKLADEFRTKHAARVVA